MMRIWGGVDLLVDIITDPGRVAGGASAPPPPFYRRPRTGGGLASAARHLFLQGEIDESPAVAPVDRGACVWALAWAEAEKPLTSGWSPIA